MDKELKAKWVAALRGGAVEQGRNSLLDTEGRMCCLGVLGRICGVSDEVMLKYPSSLGNVEPLSAIAAAFAGSYEIRRKLADMNDGGKSFPEIADYIEKNL